jgi:hypothetical protein
MKNKNVIKAVYTGETNNKAFISCCHIQMISALKKRGLLTEREHQRALGLLKEPIR